MKGKSPTNRKDRERPSNLSRVKLFVLGRLVMDGGRRKAVGTERSSPDSKEPQACREPSVTLLEQLQGPCTYLPQPLQLL